MVPRKSREIFSRNAFFPGVVNKQEHQNNNVFYSDYSHIYNTDYSKIYTDYFVLMSYLYIQISTISSK